MRTSLGRILQNYMKHYTRECKRILEIKGEKACEDY